MNFAHGDKNVSAAQNKKPDRLSSGQIGGKEEKKGREKNTHKFTGRGKGQTHSTAHGEKKKRTTAAFAEFGRGGGNAKRGFT